MKFPSIKIVKASAGSGKTYFLTKTFVAYLLSDSIHFNDLKNILAITFSNNAAIEIKEKIISWLKNIYFGDTTTLEEFDYLNIPHEVLKRKAEELLDRILNNYSEFQIRTIDSFLTKIFKAEALKFGFPGDIEIIMNNRNFMYRAFEIFLSRLSEDSLLKDFFAEVLEIIEDSLTNSSSYMWNPTKRIFREIQEIHKIISKNMIDFNDFSKDKLQALFEKFEESKGVLKKLSKEFQLVLKRQGKLFDKKLKIIEVLDAIQSENYYNEIFTVKFEKIPISNPTPEIERKWDELKKAIANFINYHSKIYYIPYLLIFFSFYETLHTLKLREQKLFIEDINKFISEKLHELSIPEVYIKLGERIYHYFIDEFQDTSPIQWKNLKILIENSLSEGGTLLLVGDTKQAIYGFRGADYSIMTDLIKEAERPRTLPSVEKYEIHNLSHNYRSADRIVNFVRDFFRENLIPYLPKFSFESMNSGLHSALTLSGLYYCEQMVKDELKGLGYVRIEKVEHDGDNKEEMERGCLLNILRKLRHYHGFLNREIAILAFKNPTIKQISTWLNEERYEFISFSSLDIRNRKIISELVHLIRFLDSPNDDFSFSTFLLGDIAKINFTDENLNWREEAERFIFSCNELKLKHFDDQPIYKRFKEKYPDIWNGFFEEPFRKVGILPLYDLITELYRMFNLFNFFPEEEAALIKFLDIVTSFEANGGGLKNFIEFYETSGEEDESYWDISKPIGRDALTLMTVHKAKGLEFPAVVLVTDLDGIRTEKINYHDEFFLRFPNNDVLENEYLRELKNLKESFLNKNLVEDLNKLYVGLTRAKEVLYILVSCEKAKKIKCPKKNPAVKCLFDLNLSSEDQYSKQIKENHREREDLSLEINHSEFRSNLSIREYRFKDNKPIDIEETKIGELSHKVVSNLKHADIESDPGLVKRIEEIIEKFKDEFRIECRIGEVRNSVLRALNNREIREFFLPIEGREVHTEKEIVDEEGNLHRIDRLIIDRDRITVLEFKFGKNPDIEKAKEQMETYMKLIRKIYSERFVQGFIYLSETDKVEKF